MTHVDTQFEALLRYLKEARGLDLTGYKRSSLMRRVGRRMSQIGMPDHAEYLDHLQVNPDEFTALFNTILINVTCFFRDLEAWDHLRGEVLPAILAAKDPDAPVRIWSAGCASGEEAYSLAIMMAEVLGTDEFRRRVKIYATDVDDDGLAQARHATYGEREIRSLPSHLLNRYFEASGDRYVFHKDLRRSVIFGRNDLVQDAPISRVDLLACRNTLMYFNAEAQTRILSRFHFALSPDGVLFLGKAEMLLSHANLFTPIDFKRRLFRKVVPQSPITGGYYLAELPHPAQRTALSGLDRLRTEAFIASPVAKVVITADGLVALINRQAETMFGLSGKDIGRPLQDLELSYRPLDLRGHIEHAQIERRPVRVADVEYSRGTTPTIHLDVQVNPLVDAEVGLLGTALIFLDVTTTHQIHDELEHANRQLETAYEELQSTNEELETTNEELQSTVEELETTNEEFQSTNEELETMNEELQSTNEELQAINDELRQRSAELDAANAFLDAILGSLQAGVTVVDVDLRVRVWNRSAEDLWGLRREEAVGQHLLNLDIGLQTDRLRPMVRQVLAGAAGSRDVRLPAINRRGRSIEVRVVGAPLACGTDGTTGAILLMEVVDGGPAPLATR